MVIRVAPLALLVVAAFVVPSTLAQDPPAAADASQTREEILKEPGKAVTFYGHIFPHAHEHAVPDGGG